jgi:hypothetical protein
MSDRTKLGLSVLAAALALGALGDALLRATPWGLNVFLWVGSLVGTVIILVRWQRIALAEGGRWLVLPVIVFSAAFTWRDSPMLKFLDALALLVVLSLMALYARSGRIHLAGLMEYALGIIVAGFSALFGPFPLVFKDIQWKEIPREGWSGQAIAVGRGLVIAFPLLILFGGLFMAADAVFENIVRTTLRLDFSELVTHIFLTALCAWIVGGYLRGMLLGKEKTIGSGQRPAFLSLTIVEIGIVLGLLDVLFLSFVMVQFRYFFGGAAIVQATTGLTYAEYARRGFFELVTVTALMLPLLLLGHWLLRKENPMHERIFRALAGAQVLMLFVIMASAVQRMRLYQSEYGLTQLRLYTTVFMGWLAIVFIWFAVTVLRGQRERFAFGALVAGFLVLATLHILNPDAFIVGTNAARAGAGRRFDANYATSLSADAVPALMAALPALDQQGRCLVAARVLRRWKPSESRSWRTWNWARAVAWRVVEEKQTTLLEMARWPEEFQAPKKP